MFAAGQLGLATRRTTDAQDSLTGQNGEKTKAVRKAVELGMIREEKDPEDGRRKLLWFITSDPTTGTGL